MALMRGCRHWLRGCADRGLGVVATNLRESTLGEDTDGIVSSIQVVSRCMKIGTYMSRQVFPQAPSPTMTSLRRISAICAMG
jgi:hypothetical protein